MSLLSTTLFLGRHRSRRPIADHVTRSKRRGRRALPCLERLGDRMLLSAWRTIPVGFDSPHATVLLSDGRLLVQQFFTNHWYLISPSASGSYAHPTITRAADSLYIHEYAGIALLKDGEVMVSGAEYPNSTDTDFNPATSGLDHIEIYNPAQTTWRNVPKPAFFGSDVITDNSIKVLPDGRVLASTGDSGIYGLYDPTTNTWTQTASIPSGSSNEVTLTMLSDGRVLAVGTGRNGNRSYLSDETSGTWTEAGQTPGMLNTGEGGPMVQLPDGQFLAIGAVQHWATQTAIYSPASGTWQAGPSVPNVSSGSPPAPGSSLDGDIFRIVPSGGSGLALEIPGGTPQNFTQAAIGPWTQADNEVWAFQKKKDGNYILIPAGSPDSALNDKYGGSANGNPVDLSPLGSTKAEEWTVTRTVDGWYTFSPASAPGDSLQVSQNATAAGVAVELDATDGASVQKWQLIESPNGSFGDEPLAALPNGGVLLADSQANRTVFYEYNPSRNQFQRVGGIPPLLSKDSYSFALNETVLPTGQVLVTGAGGKDVFLYSPSGQPRSSWRAQVLGVLPAGPGSSTQWVAGWGLNGISEGGIYGDDDSTGSNYPLVRLTSRSGKVTYSTTTNWTTTQIGHSYEAFQLTPPATLQRGTYVLRVIASGISSRPMLVHYGKPDGIVVL
jgi:hypothetical protein